MEQDKNVNSGTRLLSMFLDHFFMTFIAMFFFIPVIVKQFMEAFAVTHEPYPFTFFSGPFLYFGIIGFAIYYCKDSFNGRSIGKRITKLQVIDNKTGAIASPFQCLIRNLFIIIWPIEVIMTLINPARRIGDYVAGTKIVVFDSSVTPSKTGFIKVFMALLIAYAFVALLTWSFQSIIPKFNTFNKVKYIESSYNITESKALEKLFDDSLGKYLVADVRVYDKIENKNLKYVSIIYKLKDNYLEDESSKTELTRLTMKQLYSMYPENTFTGYAKYVYRSGNSMRATSEPIGIRIHDPGN